MCLCQALHPRRLRSAQAARGLPARPSISCLACSAIPAWPVPQSFPACPTVLPCLSCCLAWALTGSGCRPGSPWGCTEALPHAGPRARLWLCLVGLCLLLAEGSGLLGLQEGRCEPKSCCQQRWHVGNAPCSQPGAAPEHSLVAGGEGEREGGQRALHPSPCWEEEREGQDCRTPGSSWSHDNRGCGHGVLGEGDGV